MTSTVWLPSWRTSAKVAPAWPTWWRDYQKVVRDHEAGHVAITRKWEPSIESKMIGVSCPLADAAYAAASKSHDQAQEAYDKAEYPLAAARYPKWPSGYPYGSVLK
jgi:predicted secreted Zn-dependent protease